MDFQPFQPNNRETAEERDNRPTQTEEPKDREPDPTPTPSLPTETDEEQMIQDPHSLYKDKQHPEPQTTVTQDTQDQQATVETQDPTKRNPLPITESNSIPTPTQAISDPPPTQTTSETLPTEAPLMETENNPPSTKEENMITGNEKKPALDETATTSDSEGEPPLKTIATGEGQPEQVTAQCDGKKHPNKRKKKRKTTVIVAGGESRHPF